MQKQIPNAISASAAMRYGITNNESLNWAGYVVMGDTDSVTSVTCSFVVPGLPTLSGVSGDLSNLKAPPNNRHGASGRTTYASFWAGIDGWGSSTVEQAGVLMTVAKGVANYSVWYEYYPAYPVYAAWQPNAGDAMAVYVNYTASDNKFIATVIDLTTHQTYASPATTVTNADRNSAEWIAEAPSSGTILPLADFGTVEFGYYYTGLAGTNFATIGGTSGSILTLSNSFTTYQVNMVKRNGAVKATTSDLTADGTSFFVTWNQS